MITKIIIFMNTNERHDDHDVYGHDNHDHDYADYSDHNTDAGGDLS